MPQTHFIKPTPEAKVIRVIDGRSVGASDQKVKENDVGVRKGGKIEGRKRQN